MKKWVKVPDAKCMMHWEEWRSSPNNVKEDGTIMSDDEQWETVQYLFDTFEGENHPDHEKIISNLEIQSIVKEDFDEDSREIISSDLKVK